MKKEDIAQLSSRSDEELVCLYQNGIPEARDVLTARFFSSLQRFGSVGFLDSDDLRQEGMLGFLNAVETFDPQKNDSFRSYAYVCIGNRVNSAKRKTVNDFIPVEPEELLEEGHDPYISVDESETLKSVLSLCETHLSATEKSVIFCRMTGLSYEEIGEKLGMTPKAVDNALQRARNKLTGILSD